MKIVFFGSDDFAAEHLKALLASSHQVLGCVTGPDKPQGRGMKITVSPIKQMAMEKGISCVQPLTLKDDQIVGDLKAFNADIFVVVAYGRLLTQAILDLPKMLCMNVHGSLLPKYRGAAPVNWAVLNGERQTGITIQKMALQLDAGEIIAQQVMAINSHENAMQLRARMAQAGAVLLVDVLDKHPLGRFPLTAQDEKLVTYASKLTKEMGQIDWKKEVRVIDAKVRGLQPWPGTYTFFNGKMLKIIEAEVTDEDIGTFAPGQVVRVDKNGIYVACLDKVLLIKQVQPEAGKVMPAVSFAAGYKVAARFALGD